MLIWTFAVHIRFVLKTDRFLFFTKKICKQLLRDTEMLTFDDDKHSISLLIHALPPFSDSYFLKYLRANQKPRFKYKAPGRNNKIFYLFNLPLVVLVPLGRQKIHCSMDSSFPSSQLFSSSSQSACLSDLKAWSLHMGLWVVMVKNCFEFHNNNKK